MRMNLVCQDAIEFISDLDLPFEIREYQLDSFIHTIRKQRSDHY